MELIAILFGTFFVLAFLGIPVAVSLGAAAMAGMIASSVPLMSLPQRMFTGMDSFPFMAIPFFMLAGKFMEYGGISRRLVRLANVFLNGMKGGLAVAAVVASAFFAALSGSAPGTVAAIGSIMYPEMVKQKYDRNFSAGLIAVAGGLGPIIPPSIIMVTFGVTTGVSISDMFMGGMAIGLILALAFCIVAYVISARRNFGAAKENFTTMEAVKTVVSALPALGMPVIILGGIYGGIFTPTEAACVAVIYALVVGLFVYRELAVKDLVACLTDAGVAGSVIMLMIATSLPFSWIFARQGLATAIVSAAGSIFVDQTVFLLFSYLIFLIFGTLMDANAIVLLLMPFMFPISQTLGINPIHYGVFSCTALIIGCTTPPVAVNLFTAVGVTKLPIGAIVRGMMPFFVAMCFITLVYAFLPGITLFFPNMFK